MIIATNVTKKFGRLTALDNVNVTCNRGQSIALIGPNGSGKTTFIKCLLGIVRKSGGDAKLLGYGKLDAHTGRTGPGWPVLLGNDRRLNGCNQLPGRSGRFAQPAVRLAPRGGLALCCATDRRGSSVGRAVD